MTARNATEVTQAPAIGAQWPGIEGSAYAGIARGENGKPDYHLVLLADKPSEGLNWKDALAWAEKIGANLPTRDESALLYAHLRDRFEGGWHWTSTQSSSYDAWGQCFYYGTQHDFIKKFEGPARAVRRFGTSVLQSFEGAGNLPPTNTELLQQILAELKAGRADIEKIFLADIGVAS